MKFFRSPKFFPPKNRKIVQWLMFLGKHKTNIKLELIEKENYESFVSQSKSIVEMYLQI